MMKVRTIFLIAVLIFSIFIAGAAIATDNDGDGLDDDWEAANGYDNSTKETWGKDADSDGIIDDQEAAVKKDIEDDVTDDILVRYRDNWAGFAATAIISFAIFCLLAGIFTAYFGAGKSRVIGIVLTAVGAVGLLGFLYIKVIAKVSTVVGLIDWSHFHVVHSFLVVLGAIVGAIISVGLFLVSIMKA